MEDKIYDNYSIIIITHDVTIVDDIINKLKPLPVKIFNGKGFPSFSKVVNEAIVSAENDNVIIINYKARPEKHHIYKTLDLLEKGYGFVGLYRFGFFGINKNLIKKIGFFDERYTGGGCEDHDFIIRLHEHKIATYQAEEIEYIQRPTLWNNDLANIFHKKKWTVDMPNRQVYRHLQEDKYNYNLKIKLEQNNFLDESYTWAQWPWSYTFLETTIIPNY